MVRSLLYCMTLFALLTACEKPEPTIIYRTIPVHVVVPEYLRTCPEVPRPGISAETDQGDVADYVVGLYGVASECRTKLVTIDDILEKHKGARVVKVVRVPAQNTPVTN